MIINLSVSFQYASDGAMASLKGVSADGCDDLRDELVFVPAYQEHVLEP